MKDLCQKWRVKLIFRGAWNSLMAWPDWPDPHILRQMYVAYTMLKVVQERSRVSPAIRGRVPLPRIFKFIFDLKMASFDALLVVFYAI